MRRWRPSRASSPSARRTNRWNHRREKVQARCGVRIERIGERGDIRCCSMFVIVRGLLSFVGGSRCTHGAGGGMSGGGVRRELLVGRSGGSGVEDGSICGSQRADLSDCAIHLAYRCWGGRFSSERDAMSGEKSRRSKIHDQRSASAQNVSGMLDNSEGAVRFAASSPAKGTLGPNRPLAALKFSSHSRSLTSLKDYGGKLLVRHYLFFTYR